MAIGRQRVPVRDHVQQVALPSMAPLVSGETVAHGLLGGPLHLQVQRRVNPQPSFMHLLRSVLLLQILADFFHEIWGDVVGFALNVKPQRRILGALSFCRGDLAIFQHVVDHQVPATQRALWIVDRGICVRGFGKPRQYCGLLQCKVFGFLAEIEVRTRFEAVNAVAEVNLVGVQNKDLRLGEAPLDLNGQHHLLHLAPEIAVGRKKQVARELHG